MLSISTVKKNYFEAIKRAARVVVILALVIFATVCVFNNVKLNKKLLFKC